MVAGHGDLDARISREFRHVACPLQIAATRCCPICDDTGRRYRVGSGTAVLGALAVTALTVLISTGSLVFLVFACWPPRERYG